MGKPTKKEKEYVEWITEISRRFRTSQIRAAVRVNDEMLRFYWQLGKELYEKRDAFPFARNFYETVSRDLRKILPEVKSFSETNLKYMRYFYEMYPNAMKPDQNDEYLGTVTIRPQVGDDSITNPNKNRQRIKKYLPNQNDEYFDTVKNLPQVGEELAEPRKNRQAKEKSIPFSNDDFLGEMDLDVIFHIPWGHQKLILDKCRGNPKKAIFFVKATIKNNWSRAVLLNFLDTDLYERQGKALTNFKETLPAPLRDLAQEMTRDPYKLDFISLEQPYEEKDLKKALMDSLVSFLLELGNGFSFIGKEYGIQIGKTENFIDMLFYHFGLHCFVVIEVKVGEFEPSYMGQLGTYVVAVNHELKTEKDGPTLGLLVCKRKDEVKVQYALESTSQPLGVAAYELSGNIPDEIKDSLPSIEEIERELNKKGR